MNARAYVLTAALALFAVPAFAQFQETRYCGTPKREVDGDIARSPTVIRIFRRIHRCPTTGLQTGACPGWAVDHVIPLACGGCDAVPNLQWLDDKAKALKDGYERRIGALDPPVAGTEKICRFQLTP